MTSRLLLWGAAVTLMPMLGCSSISVGNPTGAVTTPQQVKSRLAVSPITSDRSPFLSMGTTLHILTAATINGRQVQFSHLALVATL